MPNSCHPLRDIYGFIDAAMQMQQHDLPEIEKSVDNGERWRIMEGDIDRELKVRFDARVRELIGLAVVATSRIFPRLNS